MIKKIFVITGLIYGIFYVLPQVSLNYFHSTQFLFLYPTSIIAYFAVVSIPWLWLVLIFILALRQVNKSTGLFKMLIYFVLVLISMAFAGAIFLVVMAYTHRTPEGYYPSSQEPIPAPTYAPDQNFKVETLRQ